MCTHTHTHTHTHTQHAHTHTTHTYTCTHTHATHKEARTLFSSFSNTVFSVFSTLSWSMCFRDFAPSLSCGVCLCSLVPGRLCWLLRSTKVSSTVCSLSDLTMCLTGDPLFFISLLCLCLILCVLLVILSFSSHSSVSVWSYVSYWWSSLFHLTPLSLCDLMCLTGDPLFFISLLCLCLILRVLLVILSFSPHSSVCVWSYVSYWWSSLFHLTPLSLSDLMCLTGDPLFFTSLLSLCLILPCVLLVILSLFFFFYPTPQSLSYFTMCLVSVLSYHMPCMWSSLFHLTPLCLSYLTMCLAGDLLFFNSFHHLCFVLPCALRVIFSFPLTSVSAGLDFIQLPIVMYQYLAFLLNHNIVYFGIHSTPVLLQ